MSISLFGGTLIAFGAIVVLIIVLVLGVVIGAYAITESLRRKCGIMLLDRKFVWANNLAPVKGMKGESDESNCTS